MGIGDLIVLLTAIQAVAARVGSKAVRVWYDATYPGAADIWQMGGIEAQAIAGDTPYPQGYAVIPCRGHIYEALFDAPRPCLYGESTGNPVGQILWTWGWHLLIGGDTIRPALYPPVGAIREAQTIAVNHLPFVTCTPLEVSRSNNDCKASQWGNILNQIDRGITILFGCVPKENPMLKTMIKGMGLKQKYEILNVPLQTWGALIDLASANYTGNSCGMWLSMASRTKTYLLQHADPTHTHNTMWNYKPRWNCRNMEIINV